VEWDFGVSSYSSIHDPFHIYNLPGIFTVTLIVHSPDGCHDTLIMPDLVQISGPTADVTVTQDSGCAPLCVTFDANPTNSISFTWGFGDGSPFVIGDPVTATASHCYTTADTMYATVLLCDNGGCCYERPIGEIYVDSVYAGFSLSQTDICSQGFVTFTDTSYAITDIVTREWVVNPGNITYSGVTATHAFSGFGDYTVTLTATTALGCVGSFTDTVHVTPSPVASFITANQPLCPGDSIQFVSTTQMQSPIATYIWNFTNPTSTISSPDSVV